MVNRRRWIKIVYEYVKHIKAALPYRVPGIKSKYLEIDIDLDRLTILIGPNASGKTAVLESIGYIMAGNLNMESSILGISLTTTLRPRRTMPRLLGGKLLLSNTFVSSLYVEVVHPLLLKVEDVITKIVKNILEEKSFRIMKELERDMSRETISRLLGLPLKYIGPSARRIGAVILLDLVKDIVGQDIEVAASRLYIPSKRALISGPETMREISRILWYPSKYLHMKIMYSVRGDILSKSMIIESPRGIVIIKRKGAEVKELPKLAVFHPGFIYLRGVFERLYSSHIREGLINEYKAIELLGKYIKWINGFELVGTILNLKSVDGKRISIYKLSDGHRVAVFMGLLYAISKPPILFLIDTPEAFVHPDGLSIVADLIVRLASEGNQIVIATQSIEFLGRLLNKAKEYGVLDDTLVERIEMLHNGIIRAKGRWSGETSLRSIEKLGIDLRR